MGRVPPGMCERCYAHGALVPAKVVHHITPISEDNVDDPNVTLNLDNLMRLCQDCHAVVHSSNKDAVRPRVAFDEHGNVIRRDDAWLF